MRHMLIVICILISNVSFAQDSGFTESGRNLFFDSFNKNPDGSVTIHNPKVDYATPKIERLGFSDENVGLVFTTGHRRLTAADGVCRIFGFRFANASGSKLVRDALLEISVDGRILRHVEKRLLPRSKISWVVCRN